MPLISRFCARACARPLMPQAHRWHRPCCGSRLDCRSRRACRVRAQGAGVWQEARQVPLALLRHSRRGRGSSSISPQVKPQGVEGLGFSDKEPARAGLWRREVETALLSLRRVSCFCALHAFAGRRFTVDSTVGGLTDGRKWPLKIGLATPHHKNCQVSCILLRGTSNGHLFGITRLWNVRYHNVRYHTFMELQLQFRRGFFPHCSI